MISYAMLSYVYIIVIHLYICPELGVVLCYAFIRVYNCNTSLYFPEFGVVLCYAFIRVYNCNTSLYFPEFVRMMSTNHLNQGNEQSAN